MAIDKKSKYLIILILICGFLGGLLFFPVQLSDGYTCFYHRIFDPDHPAMHHADHGNTSVMQHDGNELIDLYVHHYAWFWWGSLVLVAFAIYRLKFFNISNTYNSKKLSSGGH